MHAKVPNAGVRTSTHAKAPNHIQNSGSLNSCHHPKNSVVIERGRRRKYSSRRFEYIRCKAIPHSHTFWTHSWRRACRHRISLRTLSSQLSVKWIVLRFIKPLKVDMECFQLCATLVTQISRFGANCNLPLRANRPLMLRVYLHPLIWSATLHMTAVSRHQVFSNASVMIWKFHVNEVVMKMCIGSSLRSSV